MNFALASVMTILGVSAPLAAGSGPTVVVEDPLSGTTVSVVSDESSCLALPVTATWDAGFEECILGADLTLTSDDVLEIRDPVRVTVPVGTVLMNDGGTIILEALSGKLRVGGSLINTGGGTIENGGFFDVRDGGALTNSAGSTIENDNQLHVTTGSFDNAGSLTTSSALSIGFGGTLSNTGTITNTSSGFILNDGGDFVNESQITNQGTIDVGCSGWTNNGTLTGNPVDQPYCWLGGTDWSTASNWNRNEVPPSDARIIIRSVTGPTLDVAFTLTGTISVLNSNFRIGSGGSLVNEGTIRIVNRNVPGTSVITNDGTFANHASLENNDLLVNNGTFDNSGTIENTGVVGIVHNDGVFTNGAAGTFEGGLVNFASGEFRNFGVVDLNRRTNDNAGLISNAAGGTFNVNNDLISSSGALIENFGTLNVTHALHFPGTIANAAGATMVNGEGALFAITGAESVLDNDGLVENAGTIDNGGIIDNGGVICGGVVTGNTVSGNPPLPSCGLLIVTTTDDADDGDCDPSHCSLREAIAAANVESGRDTIAFRISGSGPHTLEPGTALPAITDPVLIDGYTQDGSSPNSGGAGAGTNAVLTIELSGGSAGSGVSGLRISGGGSTVRGLVINGFASHGVALESDDNVVEGSYIGTDVAGTADVGNGSVGVRVSGANNRIGGSPSGARNLISGNDFAGVFIAGSGATGNVVYGNLVGTDAAGASAVGNDIGVQVANGGTGNSIGGGAAGAGNVISGNRGGGVVLSGAGTTGNAVEANLIGTSAAGDAALPNNVGVVVNSSGNSVGGAGAGNVISGNRSEGVLVLSGTGNTIRENAIFDNGELGIDLGNDGVTANDAGDGDTGPNGLQNFPVLSGITTGSTTIEGTLNSTTNASFRLEFFVSEVCDPSGHGEAETFLGATTVTTDGGGDASFSATFSSTVEAGEFVTATATDADGNTSELSACRTLNTPVGSDVTVEPIDPTTGTSSVTVTFTTVTGGGTTSLVTSESGPEPPFGFELGDPATYYEVTTTAEHSGAELLFDFSDIEYRDPEAVRVFHREQTEQVWSDITEVAGTAQKTAVGTLDELSSLFVLLEKLPEATIDVQPGDDPNSVNCRRNGGVIPVAILTTDDFDATAVDHSTVRFGKEGTEATEVHGNPRKGVIRHEEDVDGDDDSDLVLHFRIAETGLGCDDTEARLTGETSDGTPFVGRDAINTVPADAAVAGQLDLRLSPDSAVVVSGAPASFTVALGSAFVGQEVSLSCADLAPAMTCSFSPQVLTPRSAGETATLTVSTARGTRALPASMEASGGFAAAGWLALVGLALAGLALVAGLFRRARRYAWGASLLWAVALLAACSGEPMAPWDGGPPAQVTPEGTHTFSVIAKSESLERSVTVTFRVRPDEEWAETGGPGSRP